MKKVKPSLSEKSLSKTIRADGIPLAVAVANVIAFGSESVFVANVIQLENSAYGQDQVAISEHFS